MDEIEKKARRRIRRFIETGVHQARTYKVGENLYEYQVSRRLGISIFFKRDTLGRLRKTTQP